MAEQMGCRRQWNDGSPSFALLQEVDDVVEAEAGPYPEVLPVAAAAAGARAYRTLFGLQPPVSNGGWPDGFETIQEGEADLAAMGLRAKGPSHRGPSALSAMAVAGPAQLHQAGRHPLHEVADGRLGDPMQQHPVEGFAEQAKRRLVAGAEANLGHLPS